MYAAGDTARIAAVRAMQRDGIERLLAAGARVLVGTDSYGTTAAAEARLLASDFLAPVQVLDLWSRVTPQTLFPTRRIGKLAPGWEASFVVLEADPSINFANAGRVRGGMKQGVWIDATGTSTITRLEQGPGS